jgi:hypothetical protein
MTTRVRSSVSVNLTRCEDAVDARHAHVHEHDVGSKLRGECDRFGSVGGPADDCHVGTMGKRLLEAKGKEIVIVCDQNFERLGIVGKD